MVVLALNCGSSSLKFSLFDVAGRTDTLLAAGAAEDLGGSGTTTWLEDGRGNELVRRSRPVADHRAAVEAAVRDLREARLPAPAAIGHRVVFGGATYTGPARLGRALVATLETLVPFAPLHLPAEISGIAAASALFPALPQVACFDTAFHHRMPERARRLALPRTLWDRGIRRYGFHGLSYEYVVDTIGAERLGRAVIAHLGHGASLAAVADGVSIDTTMGLTPTGGIMMSTRSGDLDPGVLLHLATVHRYDAPALDALVNRESGLAGVSGLGGDMKTLLDERATRPEAALAITMFCYHVRKQIGAFAAALGGLDTLVFTAGIGERSADVRREVCEGLEHLGVRLDARANAASADLISPPGGRPDVRVVRTNENLVVARQTCRVLEERA
ncbi:MAG: acetate/propionate family kinase [Acidobacteria bacterium]|nr:acetate/propionate family kinase [Acidobacteriota bacterium]